MSVTQSLPSLLTPGNPLSSDWTLCLHRPLLIQKPRDKRPFQTKACHSLSSPDQGTRQWWLLGPIRGEKGSPSHKAGARLSEGNVAFYLDYRTSWDVTAGAGHKCLRAPSACPPSLGPRP